MVARNDLCADPSWRVLRLRQRVGQGRDCYERCRDAALQWEFAAEGQGVVRVRQDGETKSSPSPPRKASSSSSSSATLQHQDETTTGDTVQQIWWGPGRRLCTYTAVPRRASGWIPHLYTINPVTVVYNVVDQRASSTSSPGGGGGTTYTATAYATEAGHLLRGEERVTVCHRDRDDSVEVEILSLSHAAGGFRAQLVWPLIGRLQRTFFQQQMNALQQAAEAADSAYEDGDNNKNRVVDTLR